MKGWTNGAISIEWIKYFDQNTSVKANGCYHLLLMNGHNSHYTCSFFKYAYTHKIIYTAHSIHVLQGLNVVVFVTLKHCLCEEQDKWESETGEKFSKTNFLGIYARLTFVLSHKRTLKLHSIK